MAALPLIGLIVSLLAAGWPGLPCILPKSAKGFLAGHAPWLVALSPWLRSVGLPYALLVGGMASARAFGLAGQSGEQWAMGALIVVVFGVAGGWLAVRANVPAEAEWFFAEARWSMYRAVCLWLTSLGAILACAGLLGAGLEYASASLSRRAWLHHDQALSMLMRAACSAVLFLLAPNVYLALGMYAAAAATRWFFTRRLPPSAGG
jgi:hypothetical protein